jgi:putative toxin-antitoxin system antitoxin component (TIGR02293 family)
MKAARTRDKLRQEETVDLKNLGAVFMWTRNGFRCIESLDIEVEAPSAKSVYGQSVGVRPKSREDAINILKRGLPASSFEKLHKGMAISSADLARVTNIAIRTLQRRRKQGHFQTDESERLLRLGVLFDRAIEVLGSLDAARDWMKTPQKPLAGRTPLEYIDTEPGAREVEDLLGRIEHGVFS